MFAVEKGPFLVPGPVTVEADYLLRRRLPPLAVRTFREDLKSGRYCIEPLIIGDYLRSIALCERYPGLQLTDGCVIALCERLGQTRVATVDRNDFRQVVPAHCAALDLLPEGPDQP